RDALSLASNRLINISTLPASGSKTRNGRSACSHERIYLRKSGQVNILDLFSGIGGFSLGLERAGMRTVAFCECDRYCQAVLRRHWPDVPIYDDVRTITAARLVADASAIGRNGRPSN